MTATQAPTPGPLSKCAHDGYEVDTAGQPVRCAECGDRLAPTAPVEASGSERALQDAVDFGVGFLVDGQRVSPERVTVCHGDSSPLRPQPSGETREAVARIIDPTAWATWDHQSGEINRMGLVGVERSGAITSARSYVSQSLNKTAAILALLSAHPLALGGQQGESDLCRVEKAITAQPGVKKCIAHGDISVRQIANAVLRVMGATPARAEAQDEGAAGVAVAWPKTCDGIEQPAFEEWAKSEGFDMAEHPIHYLFTDPETAAARIAWKAGLLHAVERMKAAHPSPTPAADADRVRKFSLGDRVEKTKGSAWHGRVVGFYSTSLTQVGYAVESEREPGSVQIYPEAALKSTAAKEGGAHDRL